MLPCPDGGAVGYDACADASTVATDTCVCMATACEAAGGNGYTTTRTCEPAPACPDTTACSGHPQGFACGDGGIRDGLSGSAAPLLIVMSTVLPDTVRQVRDALGPLGVRVIDAPISGGLVKATDGTLAVMVGGDAADFDAALPVLRCMGEKIFHCGELGAGEMTKIVNNMVGVTNMYLVAEAFQLALRQGLDLAKLAPVMEASSGRTYLTEDIDAARAQYAAWSEPASFFSLADIIRKDLSLAAALAGRAGLDLPVLAGAIAGTAGIDEHVLARWQAVARSR